MFNLWGKNNAKDSNSLKEEANLNESKILDELVERVKAGDMEAFGRIYELLVDKVYRYIYFKVPGEAAFDLTENVFLKIWENIKKYQVRSGSTFSSWVFRIAHNMMVDYHRFNKDTAELSIETADSNKENNPVFVADNVMSKESLMKSINLLKPTYQEILRLSFLSELSNTEVAKIVGKNEGTIRVLKFRALQELKKILLESGIKN